MSYERQQLESAIAALSAQRQLLGDDAVDTSIVALRSQLDAMSATSGPLPKPTQTLRQVSILFMDVVGSTALAQQLDPEAVSALMDDALARGTAVVEAARGKVLQYAGDNILAAFGAEGAREDDAERAVHCGLALLELGHALGKEVLSAHGPAGFNVRVGIHTGGVLLGGGIDAEGTIRGSAVNIAARMEQMAASGALRISHDTYAHVRGLFEVDAREPLSVKGVEAPVMSYRVLRAKPRNFRIRMRGIEGLATKMIGRDAELEALQAAYARLFAERKFAAVTVVADAGIGKSRLLYEFQAWSETRPETFFLYRGRATPQTGTQAFGLLRDIFAWRLQINDDDEIEVARKKMEDSIVPLFIHDDGPDVAEGNAHLLGHLIGIEWRDSRHVNGILDDPKQIRNRAFHAAAQIFRRVGAANGLPVILQLEDLHWADSESLDFLNYVTEVNRDVPLLVLSFTRPTLFERRLDWSGTAGIHQRIDLQPLGKDMSRVLANELLKKMPVIPATLRELLISNSEGNPFYMEELLTMLIDQGAIQTQSDGGDAWKVNAERLLVTQVPPTLTGVLQARLDGLPVAEKRALQQASVVGAVFWDQALAAVDAQAAEHLPALVQRELTLPRTDAQLEGLREYAFRHQVLHQVTYDTVLKVHKRDGHARVAQWLAGLTGQGSLRAGDVLGMAAEHFEQAGDEANAAEFHARAAEHAAQRFAHDRVLEHVNRALAMLGEAHAAPPAQLQLRWRLLSAHEQTLFLQARRDEQAADLDAMAQLADALNDDRRRAEVSRRRGIRAMRMADWAVLDGAARDGMASATRAGDEGLRLQALWLLACATLHQGDVDGARTLALQCLDESRSLNLRGIEARVLNLLATAAERHGDDVGALNLQQQSLRIHRETGDRINEAIVLGAVGECLMKLGDLPQARLELDAALKFFRTNGDRTLEGAALCVLSVLALWQGDETRALALAHSALEIIVAAQARDEEVLAALRLGEAELALGRVPDARQAFLQARMRALEVGSAWHHDANAGLARVALAKGDIAAAVAAVQPVLDFTAGGGTLDGTEFPRLIELTCHQTLALAMDPRAADWLVRAHAALVAQVESISDVALRRGFLKNIPHHHAIVLAWAKHEVSRESPAE